MESKIEMDKEKTSGRQRGRGCEVVKKRKREKNKLVKPRRC